MEIVEQFKSISTRPLYHFLKRLQNDIFIIRKSLESYITYRVRIMEVKSSCRLILNR